MSWRRSVAVTIPAYQASPSVANVIRGCLEIIGEVLVIDDGSTDDTAKVAVDAGARVIRHARNFGKGRALHTAFADLFDRGYEQVLTLDADGQHLSEELPRLLDEGRLGADLVIGSRDHLFSKMHPIRTTGNRASSFIISSLAGQMFGDVQSGFRLYTRRLIDTVGFPEPRFEAESAVVVRACRAGFHVTTTPVRLGFADGRVTSHYRPMIDSIRIAIAVTRARLELVGCPAKRRS